MLHINITNYKKPKIFLKIFPKFSEKITEFSQNFQKKLQEISEKITIKPTYIVNIFTRKFVNLQNLRAASISNTKRLFRLLQTIKHPFQMLSIHKRL